MTDNKNIVYSFTTMNSGGSQVDHRIEMDNTHNDSVRRKNINCLITFTSVLGSVVVAIIIIFEKFLS